MGSININGKSYNVSGNNISVVNGKVIVDGKIIEENLSGVVEVKFEGALASLRSDASVTCGNVHGDVKAGSSVKCLDVDGNVNAGSSVNCNNVGGNVKAGSSINYKR